MSSYYQRYEDGTSPDDGHSYWSFQRRAQIINSCYYRKEGRFKLGVHTKRFLAITELAGELVGSGRGGDGGWDMVCVEQGEQSVITEEISYSDEEGDGRKFDGRKFDGRKFDLIA